MEKGSRAPCTMSHGRESSPGDSWTWTWGNAHIVGVREGGGKKELLRTKKEGRAGRGEKQPVWGVHRWSLGAGMSGFSQSWTATC